MIDVEKEIYQFFYESMLSGEMWLDWYSKETGSFHVSGSAVGPDKWSTSWDNYRNAHESNYDSWFKMLKQAEAEVKKVPLIKALS